MDDIKELNLKEISYLADKFGIVQTGPFFSIRKTFSTTDLLDLIDFINKEIWHPKNIERVISTIKNQHSDELLYYWLPSELEPIDSFLERAGILNYKVVMSCPLSFIVGINPDYKDSPNKKPDLYLEFLFENALFLVSLNKWIETDQLLLLPHLPAWDYSTWKTLGKINKKIFEEEKIKDTEEMRKFERLGLFESGVRLVSGMLRSQQKHYNIDHVKRILSIEDKVEAERILKYMQSLSKYGRDIAAVHFLAKKCQIDEETFKDRLERLEKQQLFHAENYIDISKLDASMKIHRGMSLTMALYTSDKLKAIPITDQKLHKLACDLYAKAITFTDEYKERKEFIESKIELEVPFLTGLSPEFIKRQKNTGVTLKLRSYLDEKWEKIRKVSKIEDFKLAVKQLSDSVNYEYNVIKNDLKQIRKETIAEIGEVVIKSVGAFAEGLITQRIWFAITKSLTTLFGGGLAAYKSYDHKKYELKRNPLFIFLQKKK